MHAYAMEDNNHWKKWAHLPPYIPLLDAPPVCFFQMYILMSYQISLIHLPISNQDSVQQDGCIRSQLVVSVLIFACLEGCFSFVQFGVILFCRIRGGGCNRSCGCLQVQIGFPGWIYIKNLMGLSGLSVREDAVGNIFGRWEGYEPELTAVATGSHIDAIPYSGKYDGVVGVLGAIEAINVLRRGRLITAWIRNPKLSTKGLGTLPVSAPKYTKAIRGDLVHFRRAYTLWDQLLGSRLLAGNEVLMKSLETVVDSQNISFFDAARAAGYANDEEDLPSVFLKKGSYSAFVELHIEQGPILEEEGISIGIVTAIAAPASIKVDFEGNGGHAGAVLMPNRNDAGLAAAELALAVEKHVLESGSIDTVGTVGILELHPGAINSIPSKSHLEIAKNRGVRLSEFKIINQDPPALSDKSITKAMQAASQELNLSHKLMISRAYHDSLFMARISPMGMIFIPCYKGYSHKPEEYASIEI
ncbi:Ureidoglycolate hydrolase [Vitis vinifera]|uniref:Ureidoglycolate hydrolase n=1 Tax=Vitis vinifera TaxID=29760 RepID=A0A438F696_VITVI|nr:Ureidoglycolate hydrolase [Vitis vinifera]